MKKISVALLLSIIFLPAVFAQTATVRVTMANTAATQCVFVQPSKNLMSDYQTGGYVTLRLSPAKTAVYTVDLKQPEFITLYCDSTASRRGKHFSYPLFLSPGDNLDVKADFAQKDFAVTITGKGANNNQPLRQAFFGTEFYEFSNDTLPARLIAAINKTDKVIREQFKTYVEQYKPSTEFINAMRQNVDYYAADKFYELKENNKFGLGEAYYRNIAQWKRVTDSLFTAVKLNDAEALSAPNYRALVRYYLLREKEALWRRTETDSVAFFKEWYNTNVTEGRKAFMDDRSNLLQEKLINKYFTGEVAEYLYAVLFDGAFEEANPANMVDIFKRFKEKFPDSRYLAVLTPGIENIIAKERNALNSDMVFAANNGTDLSTMEDVVKLAKGKTVLLDMWGTWCGPCRSEIEKNSAAIKDYFKNKGLVYFYVANHDLKNQDTWKKLIAYFKLTGNHILANEKLSADIMEKVKGEGYPTYIIIKKDGSYEQSKAGYPMDRAVLIKQLEDALAVK